MRVPEPESPATLLERVRAHLAGEGRPPSRRQAEAWIRAGAARLDGAVARDPAAPVPPHARLSVDLDDLPDEPRAPRASGPAPRARPPGVLHADAQLVVVERAAFPDADTPDALAAAVGIALAPVGGPPLALLPVPDPSAPGSGPVLLAGSRAAAARLAAMVRAGQVLETLLSLRAPPTLGPGEALLDLGDPDPDAQPLPGTLIERSDAPLAPPPPGTRSLVPPHRALLTLKHPRTQRRLELAAPPPPGWPRPDAGDRPA